MAVGIVQHRRRTSGAAGAPATMAPGEIAVNEIDGIVYYGVGVNTSDSTKAASIIAIAGTAKQNVAANLTALAALTGAADRLPYFTGAGALSLATLTSFARSLLDDADAATALTTLGAAPLASPSFTGTPTAPTPAVNVNTQQIQTTAGALAQMRYFGLGSTLETSTSNLDTINETSMYRVTSTSGVTGVPIASLGLVFTQRYSNTYAVQEFHTSSTTASLKNRSFRRFNNAGTWEAWSEITPVANNSVSVATIAALKALDKASKSYAEVYGYYAAGDGGGGLYYLDAADTTSTDNGGTVIVATDGGRWKLNHDGRVSIKQFGARGNDTADDTSAVQAAITWAGVNNAGLYVPSAPVAYKLTATINITDGLLIYGDNIELTVGTPGNLNTRGQGSWFHIAHTGKGFSVNAGGTTPLRFTLDQVATYRDQPTPGASSTFTPAAHDFDYYLYNCDSVMTNFVTLNCTKGVQITADAQNSQSRASFAGWRGQPLNTGLQIDFCADVVRFDDVHFWPYWANHSTVYDYIAANAYGVVSYRNDNPMLTRYFTYGYAYSIYMGTNSFGSTSKMKLQEFDFDAFGKSAIYLDGANVSIQVNQGSAQGKGSETAAVANNFIEFSASASGCFAQLSNVDAGLTRGNTFRVGGTGNNVLFLGSCIRAYQWNASGSGFPAIEATNGNFIEMGDYPYLTAPLNSGLPFASSGDIRGRRYLRGAAYTSDANGKITITHGFGRAPAGAFAQVLNGSTAYNLQIESHGGTSSVFVLRNASGAVVPNQAVNVTVDLVF